MNEKEKKSLAALQELGLEIADRWASGLQKRPTQQLVLQKVIEPVVRHILNTIFPWIIGVAILFWFLCYVLLSRVSLYSGRQGHMMFVYMRQP